MGGQWPVARFVYGRAEAALPRFFAVSCSCQLLLLHASVCSAAVVLAPTPPTPVIITASSTTIPPIIFPLSLSTTRPVSRLSLNNVRCSCKKCQWGKRIPLTIAQMSSIDKDVQSLMSRQTIIFHLLSATLANLVLPSLPPPHPPLPLPLPAPPLNFSWLAGCARPSLSPASVVRSDQMAAAPTTSPISPFPPSPFHPFQPLHPP